MCLLFVINLHSTMYLLNLDGIALTNATTILFTFHYVSIKSASNLSAMPSVYAFTFHYVSIKSLADHVDRYVVCSFTFHYVSIKSNIARHHVRRVRIYIPLCIY